eukprot:10325053-Alexandrium_andersonii.AAC.1
MGSWIGRGNLSCRSEGGTAGPAGVLSLPATPRTAREAPAGGAEASARSHEESEWISPSESMARPASTKRHR